MHYREGQRADERDETMHNEVRPSPNRGYSPLYLFRQSYAGSLRIYGVEITLEEPRCRDPRRSSIV